jgi:hypothetical protein
VSRFLILYVVRVLVLRRLTQIVTKVVRKYESTTTTLYFRTKVLSYNGMKYESTKVFIIFICTVHVLISTLESTKIQLSCYVKVVCTVRK